MDRSFLKMDYKTEHKKIRDRAQKDWTKQSTKGGRRRGRSSIVEINQDNYTRIINLAT